MTALLFSYKWQWLLQIYLKWMYQTPYELLLRKSRQQKIDLLHNIKQNNLKYRSISSNMRVSSDRQQDPEVKPKEKEKQERQNRANYISSIKKSYYYRQFLNKSVEGQLTHQQMQKLKENFNKVAIQHQETERNPAIFRQIWENQIQKRCLFRQDEDKELSFIVTPKKKDKNSDSQLRNSTKPLKNQEQIRKKAEDAPQIVKNRIKSLDLDFQIQGNRKSLRMKDSTSFKLPKKIQNKLQVTGTDTQQAEIMDSQNKPLSLRDIQRAKVVRLKPVCHFFKKIEQPFGRQSVQQHKNVYIKIKKICPDKRHYSQDSHLKASKKLSVNRYEGRNELGQTVEQREVRSSWNSGYQPQSQRYYKLQTSEKCRVSIRKRKKLTPYDQSNEFQGWNVKLENEDLSTEVFGV